MKIITTNYQSYDNLQEHDTVLYSNILNTYTLQFIITLLNNLVLINYTFFSDVNTVKYNNLPPLMCPLYIEKLKHGIEKISTFTFNSCIISTFDYWKTTTYSSRDNIIPTLFINKNINHPITINNTSILNGSLLIDKLQTKVNCENTDYIYVLTFLNIQSNIDYIPRYINKECILNKNLTTLYLYSNQRYNLKKVVQKEFIPLHSMNVSLYTLDIIHKIITFEKLIGSGDWGCVYPCFVPKINYMFACKLSKISQTNILHPYSTDHVAFYEYWILKKILSPLIKYKICPHLPLLYDSFLLNKSMLPLRKENIETTSIMTIMELASGDLKTYLTNGKFTTPELYTILFQLMYALHCLQMSGQLLHNDIKASNILFYNIKKGGYFKYTINNIKYYVPNYGKLFIINDFGVSKLFNPNYQLYSTPEKQKFNLGSRYAININEYFHPIYVKSSHSHQITWNSVHSTITTSNCLYTLNKNTHQIDDCNTKLTSAQKQFLFNKSIPTHPLYWQFFEHPYILPPFEFYNDVQDIIRIFIGGKRTTQKGTHSTFSSISPEFITNLNLYKGQAVCFSDKTFSFETHHVLAGSFITTFFKKVSNFTIKPVHSRKIESYKMVNTF